MKLLSAVAFLPALLQGSQDFIRFRDRNAAQAGDARQREAAWGYLMMQVGIGLAMMGFFVISRWITKDAKTPLPFVFVGLWIAGSVWIAVRAKCRMERNMDSALPPLFAKAKPVDGQGFEQRSAVEFLGLPLYHIRLGQRLGWRAPAIKGWIAISDDRAIGGLFASGIVAVAPVSLGVACAGGLSLGGLAIGVWAAGGFAIGWLTAGLAAVGGCAAKGIFTLAPQWATGTAYFAAHANDALAKTFFQEQWFYRFVFVGASWLIWACLLGWVMPIVLTGWQLWRTRKGRA